MKGIYTISQVCTILGMQDYTLRYLEKTLQIKITRDTMKNRIYYESDIKLLKEVLRLKKAGYPNKYICLHLTNESSNEEKNISPCSIKNNNENNSLVTSTDNHDLLQKIEARQNNIEQCLNKMSARIDCLDFNKGTILTNKYYTGDTFISSISGNKNMQTKILFVSPITNSNGDYVYFCQQHDDDGNFSFTAVIEQYFDEHCKPI